MKHYPVHFLSRKLRSTLRVTVAILAVATVLLVTGPLMSAQTQPTFGGCFEMADTSGHRLTTDVEPNAIAAQGENALAFTGTHYGNVEQAMDYSYTTVPVTVYNSGVTNITGPGLGLDASGNTIYAVWAQNGTLWFNSGSATPGQEGYVWGAASYYYPSLSGVSYPPRVVLWGGNPWVVAVSNGIIYFSQIGGTTWYSTPFTAAGGASVTLFNNELWLAWTNPTTGHVNVAYTTNGIPTFGPAIDTGISVKGSIPQLFTFSNGIYFGGFNSTGQTLIAGSTDGSSWTLFPAYGQLTNASPSFVAWGSDLFEYFKSYYNSNLWVCHQ